MKYTTSMGECKKKKRKQTNETKQVIVFLLFLFIFVVKRSLIVLYRYNLCSWSSRSVSFVGIPLARTMPSRFVPHARDWPNLFYIPDSTNLIFQLVNQTSSSCMVCRPLIRSTSMMIVGQGHTNETPSIALSSLSLYLETNF